MSNQTKIPPLDALLSKRNALRGRAERITAGIALAESTVEALEAERADLERGAHVARSQAAAEQIEKFMAGGNDVRTIASDEKRITALASLKDRIEVAGASLRELRSMHSNVMRELESVEASRHAEVDTIVRAAIEAQAAAVEKLRAEYLKAGTVLRELLPDETRSRFNASRFASDDVLRILDELPRPNDLNVSGQFLRLGHSRLRDRFAEMRAALLADDSDAAIKRSVAA